MRGKSLDPKLYFLGFFAALILLAFSLSNWAFAESNFFAIKAKDTFSFASKSLFYGSGAILAVFLLLDFIESLFYDTSRRVKIAAILAALLGASLIIGTAVSDIAAPRHDVLCRECNLVLIVLGGLSPSDITEQATPTLYALSKESQFFERTYSTSSFFPRAAMESALTGESAVLSEAYKNASERKVLPDIFSALSRSGYRNFFYTETGTSSAAEGREKAFATFLPDPGNSSQLVQAIRANLQGNSRFALLADLDEASPIPGAPEFSRTYYVPETGFLFAENEAGAPIKLSPTELETGRRAHKEHLRKTDERVKNLLDSLSNAGYMKRTVVSVVSTYAGAAGTIDREIINTTTGKAAFPGKIRPFSRNSFDPETERVVFFAQIPDSPGGRVRQPHSLLDVPGTLAGILGTDFGKEVNTREEFFFEAPCPFPDQERGKVITLILQNTRFVRGNCPVPFERSFRILPSGEEVEEIPAAASPQISALEGQALIGSSPG